MFCGSFILFLSVLTLCLNTEDDLELEGLDCQLLGNGCKI